MQIKEELLSIAWHPSWYWDWCVLDNEKNDKKVVEWWIMKNFKLVQIEVSSWFSQAKNILTIDLNKVLLSDRLSLNNGKEWRYIVADGETTIPLLIKTPKNIFSLGVSQYIKNSVYTLPFNVFEVPEWLLHYRNTQNEVEFQLIEKVTTRSVKEESKYIHCKLKMCKERNKTNFHGHGVPYYIYYNAAAVLNVYSVYK